MDEGTFESNFVWYEWTFVSPSDVPEDDPQGKNGRSGERVERSREDEPVWRT